MKPLKLTFGLRFQDLFTADGLGKLDSAWLASLDAELATRIAVARVAVARKNPLADKEQSTLMIDLAESMEEFFAELFGIAAEVKALQEKHNPARVIHRVKRNFVQRRAAKKYRLEDVKHFEPSTFEELMEQDNGGGWDESTYAAKVGEWLEQPQKYAAQLELAARYAGWALYGDEGRRRHQNGVLFKLPPKIDPFALIPLEQKQNGKTPNGTAFLQKADDGLRHRDGFDLTDTGMTLNQALDQAHYCIFCHEREKDSCAKGFKDDRAEFGFRNDAFSRPLIGCPLEERISEMNLLKSKGFSLSALAVAMVDNPMIAGTGHRICNDCMKSCIYQKQQPVDIPQVETRTLKDVLHLPWGFEIYALLSRWNPMNFARPLPKSASGRTILVAGLGPAGYTLVHHLLNEGHNVAAVDGLKIEPLAPRLSGVKADGSRTEFEPIYAVDDIKESLASRRNAGFGGVAEYGITSRWDKNYLKIIRLLLERRAEFAMYGGIRLGSEITINDAFDMGFDHVALALGAGRPRVLSIPNGLAKGMRQASDFLMALQLTGAAKRDSITNLQLRLPVVVIGGGLTAVDAATEARAYYSVQVEKFYSRYLKLVEKFGGDKVRGDWGDEETAIADEFIAHAEALRGAKNEPPTINRLLESWGGVTIAYRRSLVESPAYTLNHEEVAQAMDEGIRFAEGLSPQALEVDEYGAVKRMKFTRAAGGEHPAKAAAGVVLEAKTVLVAAGTYPNTVLARETDEITAVANGFVAIDELDEDKKPLSPPPTAKPSRQAFITEIRPDRRAVSFFGDLHPSYAGNVVSAMASAKNGYPYINRVLAKLPRPETDFAALKERLDRRLRPKVVEVKRLAPKIIEVIISAPAAAEKFKPGQFFRLQNYEANAPKLNGTTLAMEGLAMTGAWVDKQKGLVSVIVLEMGGSSDVCRLLKPAESVVLMGPTGHPTVIPQNETVLLIGGGLGNAVLFSIGKAMRENGNKVLYFAAYRRLSHRYKKEQIEAAADAVVWCCEESPGFKPDRPQDLTFVGNVVEAMIAYGDGGLGEQSVALNEVNRLLTIGSDTMMAAVAKARHTSMAAHLKRHIAIASINSPMQCMMKEICAQCLQRHIDENGNEKIVYSCYNQDQPLDAVDFACLGDRLAQNTTGEKLTAKWLEALGV